jgi:Mg-chelatase subunit ChlI
MHDGCRAQHDDKVPLPRSTCRTPMVELPLNATEDRLVGTLHIEHALRTGERRFEPGVLAAANRGILYVDEVNLLDDHLVDMLLDAASSGVNVVEREGISYTHPAQFLLIGTMNPEEGELRPQFLDRFGLCVSVKELAGAEERRAIVRRRLAFEENPARFLAEWSGPEESLRGRIAAARAKLTVIRQPEDMLNLAVRLAIEVEAHGHRAEILILKAARALAALLEKTEIEECHVLEAASYVLPHRVRRTPLSTPEVIGARVEEAIARATGRAPITAPAGDTSAGEEEGESIQVPGAAAAGSILFAFEKKKSASSTPTSASELKRSP